MARRLGNISRETIPLLILFVAQQKPSRGGLWHPILMQFYSGPLMQLLSGVDTVIVTSKPPLGGRAMMPAERVREGVDMEIKGGCLCGAVRYTAEADPTSATVCHCRDCQKFTGSAFAALIRVTKEAVSIEGTLKTFTSIGGSGNPILRHFCPECGSSIAEESGTRPGIIILNVGTFDNPTVARPGREIFRDDALPWLAVHGEIPRFAKRPA